MQMWHLGTWFSGGLGSVRLTVGLNDLKGLYDSKFRASTCAQHPRVPGPPAETPGRWETLSAGKDEELQVCESVFLGQSL